MSQNDNNNNGNTGQINRNHANDNTGPINPGDISGNASPSNNSEINANTGRTNRINSAGAFEQAPQTPPSPPRHDYAREGLKTIKGILPKKPKSGRFSGPLARCVFIALITIMLLVPLGLVEGMVFERSYLYDDATHEIASSWGGEQTVSGPALIIPYQVWHDRKDMIKVIVGNKEQLQEKITREYHTRHKVVLPSDLTFDAALATEMRYRGIYKQALYTAPVDIHGSFTLPQVKDFSANTTKIYWDQAWLSIGITDLKTIAEAEPPLFNGKPLPAYKPGAEAGSILGPGFHSDAALDEQSAGQTIPFALKLKIRGSGGIAFTPVGEKTVINMSGNWSSPSFQGNLLPAERTITDKDFSARWVISNLTRSYPQTGDLETYRSGKDYGNYEGKSAITGFTAGMTLLEPVSLYRMVKRSVAYGILFIAVTFVALFAFEMISRRRMHLLQYAMVGLSMSLFYLALLSLSEHIGFGPAFTAAAAVTVLMNSLYLASALQSLAKGLLMGGLLSGLYALLFSLLRMQDFALVMGTGLVLTMMAVLMFVTRKLPQYQPGQE